MTLIEAAHALLTAAQSGSLEATDGATREFAALAHGAGSCSDIPEVLSIIQQARTAIYAQRAQIVMSLQNAGKSELYAQRSSPASCWEFDG